MYPHAHVFLVVVLFFSNSECRREIDITQCQQKINIFETLFPFFYVDNLADLRNPTLHLLFDRDDLAVTSYVGTPSVNLAIQNSAAVVIDFATKEDEIINVEVSGIANVFSIDNKFRDCTVYVRAKQNTFFLEPGTLNNDFDQCISSVICEKLGFLEYQDLERGRNFPHIFGPNSLESSNSIVVAHPDIYPSEIDLDEIPQSYKKPNEIVHFILQKLAEYYKRNKLIIVPDIKDDEHEFFASYGYFKGFDFIQRDTRTPVEVYQLKNDLKQIIFDFGVLFGRLTYGNFLFSGKSLCADVKELIFTATITMNHGQQECLINLDELKVYPGTLKIQHCDGSEVFPVIIKEWILNSWTNVILPSIKNMLEIFLKSNLQNYKFNCNL